ncbi:MAG: type II toxin-antitoxin system RelE/ParE family toxin [Anaerolineaceae bacterium]|nr:type II toxin-antitoxin system RelE/ParE family toxin [Anaerolineaceae bacterium]
MIKSFADKDTDRLFRHQPPRRLPPELWRRATRKLMILNAVIVLDELRVPPSNHLEKLSGNRKGQHSIRINDQWRICFTWRNGDAYDVEITDYH